METKSGGVGAPSDGGNLGGNLGRSLGKRPGQRQAGFTLTKLALSMTVMLVALVSTSAANLRSSALQRQSREQAVAVNLVRSVVERLRATSEQARLNADPTTPSQSWAALVSQALSAQGAIGTTFHTPLLTPQAANGQVGSILLITNEQISDATLGVAIGMPRDLDGDGVTASNDVSQSARVLPVVINVAWRSESGTHSMRHPILLTDS